MPLASNGKQIIYPAVIEEEYFDPELYDLYWRFIAERQTMYVRRAILGIPRPWTTDPILNSEFITNIYRELDPGTMYVISDILSLTSIEDRVFHVLLYRLMGSQAETHRRIINACPRVKSFKLDKFLESVADVEKGSMFGDAYRVAGYETEGGTTKIENVGRMFERIAKQIGDITKSLLAATNTREAYEAIKSVQGFGDFLAHQVTVDLLYKDGDGRSVLPFGEDDWAMPGPGARNGMWAMLAPHVKPRNLQIVMRFLRDKQHEEFAKRDIRFPYLADRDERQVDLSLCNIQSTLCEFYKYVRIWDGSSSKVRRYQPPGNDTQVIPSLPLWFSSGDGAVEPSEVLEMWRSLPCLTPRPPIGGRSIPERANQPEPEIDPTPAEPIEIDGPSTEQSEDDIKRLEEPFRALEGHSEGQVLSVEAAPGLTIHISINIWTSPQPS